MGGSSKRSVDLHLRASREAQQRGRFDAMLAHARQATAVDDGHLAARFRLFECLLYCGYPDRVKAGLAAIEERAGADPALWARVGEFYTHCIDHEAARRCYRRAVDLEPRNPDHLFALSAAEVAVGDLETAERHLNEVIRQNPHDYDAYRNRATLARASPAANHIAGMEALLAAGVKTPAGEVQLCYALARELEDIGDHERAFEYLKRGADKRRSLLSYRVEGDLAVLAKLRTVFDERLLSGAQPAHEVTGPIFVIGLPRSGTTLVDRMLSSHSQVASLGEINDFAYALMHTIGQSASKLDLIDLAARTDFAALGRRYVDGLRRYGRTETWLIDKTPLNFLYVGLIRLALPNARVVHIRRNPMDSCFGMYRELFRAGYPFSYDFDDLVRYYVAWRQLMEHWHSVAPGFVIDVRYEALVDDPKGQARAILERCGLDWEPGCHEFHRNTSSVATASSAQVRRPLYRDAVGRWRRYESQLQPLKERLEREGIDVVAA